MFLRFRGFRHPPLPGGKYRLIVPAQLSVTVCHHTDAGHLPQCAVSGKQVKRSLCNAETGKAPETAGASCVKYFDHIICPFDWRAIQGTILTQCISMPVMENARTVPTLSRQLCALYPHSFFVVLYRYAGGEVTYFLQRRLDLHQIVNVEPQ